MGDSTRRRVLPELGRIATTWMASLWQYFVAAECLTMVSKMLRFPFGFPE
jgi:hypothetical protein